MPFDISFYAITTILTIIIIVRAVVLGDILAVLGIVVSIIALYVDQPPSATDESRWLIRKDYTSSGTLFETNPGAGWTSNQLDKNIIINRTFRLHVQFLESKGSNAVLLYGRETESQNWWEGMVRFELGIENDGERIYYNVWGGTGEAEPSPFLTGGFSKPKDGVVIVEFDSRGKRFSVLNSAGYVIQQADVTQNKNTAKGLFPEGIKLVELTSGPNSEMKIARLLILEPFE